MVFEQFVAMEEAAYDGDFCFDNVVESFWPILQYFLSCFFCEFEFLIDDVCPVIICELDAVPPDLAYFYGLDKVV